MPDLQAGIEYTASLDDAHNLARLDYPILFRKGGEWDDYVAKLKNQPNNVYNDLPGIAIIDQAGKIAAIHHGSGDVNVIADWVTRQVDSLLDKQP